MTRSMVQADWDQMLADHGDIANAERDAAIPRHGSPLRPRLSGRGSAPAPVFVLSIDGGVLQSIETDAPAGTPRPRFVLVDYDVDGIGTDERVKLVGEKNHPGSRYATAEDMGVNDDTEYVARVLKAADQSRSLSGSPCMTSPK